MRVGDISDRGYGGYWNCRSYTVAVAVEFGIGSAATGTSYLGFDRSCWAGTRSNLHEFKLTVHVRASRAVALVGIVAVGLVVAVSLSALVVRIACILVSSIWVIIVSVLLLVV